MKKLVVVVLLLAGQAWAAQGYGVVKCGNDFRVLTGKPPTVVAIIYGGEMRTVFTFNFQFNPSFFGLGNQPRVLFAKFTFTARKMPQAVIVPRARLSYEADSKYLSILDDFGFDLAVPDLVASVVATNGRCTAEVFFDIEFGPME